MIESDGYCIYQEVNNNRIVILLPQTLDTMTNTRAPYVDRKVKLTSEEESIILQIVRMLVEKKE